MAGDCIAVDLEMAMITGVEFYALVVVEAGANHPISTEGLL